MLFMAKSGIEILVLRQLKEMSHIQNGLFPLHDDSEAAKGLRKEYLSVQSEDYFISVQGVLLFDKKHRFESTTLKVKTLYYCFRSPLQTYSKMSELLNQRNKRAYKHVRLTLRLY